MKQTLGLISWLLAMVILLPGCFAEKTAEEQPAIPQEAERIENQEKVAEDTETPPVQEPEDTEFVRVTDYVPGIRVELQYATPDNFTGQVIYNFSDAYLRYGTVKKLSAAQSALAELGCGLKIWDAFRPPAAQFLMWEICPDSTYVANPNKGFSSHSRGNTVDLTLVTSDGAEVVMPTGFDDFSKKADRDYSDVEPEAAEHAMLLENVMTDAGFQPYAGEWWHFSDTDFYEVEESFLPEGE